MRKLLESSKIDWVLLHDCMERYCRKLWIGLQWITQIEIKNLGVVLEGLVMSLPDTNRDLSIKANEFVWTSGGLSQVHDYVGAPILKQLQARKVKSVLDLGCGNGALSHFLSQQGFSVSGCDGSESGIELARKNFPDVHFERYDILEPLPAGQHGKFDAVVSVEVIEHLLLPRKLIENSLTALKPGGLLIITTPYHGYWKNLGIALANGFDNHWHPLRDFGHVKFFSKATIIQLMEEFNLKQIHFQTVGRIPIFARSMIVSGIKAG